MNASHEPVRAELETAARQKPLGPLTSLSLAQLADEANECHRQVHHHVSAGVENAIAAGEVLLEVRSRVQPGEWVRWIEDNLEIDVSVVKVYIRLATYKDEVRKLGSTSVQVAKRQLRGLPKVTPLIQGAQKPEHVKDHAKRLVRDGVPLRQVAKIVGVHHVTVRTWVDPEYRKKRNAKQREISRQKHAAKKALEREKKAAAMKSVAGATSESYALIRKALAATQSALDDAENRALERQLRETLDHLYRAEDAITGVLSVHRGGAVDA